MAALLVSLGAKRRRPDLKNAPYPYHPTTHFELMFCSSITPLYQTRAAGVEAETFSWMGGTSGVYKPAGLPREKTAVPVLPMDDE